MEIPHVLNVYNAITSEFDKTRFSIWKGVKQFLDEIPTNSLLLDCGCGNGKYLDYRPDIMTTGLDVCSPLLDIVLQKQPTANLILASVSRTHLPFIQNAFDYTICIAVLHHLDTHDNRLDFIRQLLRVTRNKLLITVWAREQNISQKWKKINENGDYFVPWVSKKTGETFMRYYHLFSLHEVNEIIRQLNIQTYECYFENDNWNIILVKS